MSRTVTNPQSDRRTLTQRGSEIGTENVELLQNTPGVMSPVLRWTMPRKFSKVEYGAGVHPTRFVPRTVETATGDGAATTFALTTSFLPTTGETDIDEQPWPSVVAYDVTAGTQLNIVDAHYGANEVTLETAPATGNNLKFYPVMADGTVQFRGIDQFGHEVGSLDQWGTPMQDFSDHDQMKEESMIHLVGSLTIRENETWAFYVDSPDQIVWQDADYPEGEYVTTIEQKVDVSV